ncbi:hypothetical protein LCD36_04655 [Saccharopolyspora sp. 6T]|uniref:hypothetical protein n=1 Tax=Saccharopolyspora sp. 6T TaxID=2877238 RepID=UPI001CD6DC36|nr:hypothetical protein [Saccharopolyspora sp. 6T]MCA1185743.1 hypothetical protein [Saccharopolyspora sp. 6T]
MGAFVKLEGVAQIPQGLKSFHMDVQSEDGTSYSLPIPLAQISQSPVVFVQPKFVPTPAGAEIHFGSWLVVNGDSRQRLPLTLPDMAAAMRAANEFLADSGISWSSADEDIYAWTLAYVERAKAGGR